MAEERRRWEGRYHSSARYFSQAVCVWHDAGMTSVVNSRGGRGPLQHRQRAIDRHFGRVFATAIPRVISPHIEVLLVPSMMLAIVTLFVTGR